MMESIVHLISVLLGMFSILAFYIYMDFRVADPVETFKNPVPKPKPEKVLERFILLATFDEPKDISNAQSRWYNNSTNVADVNMEDLNYNQYFSISNTLTFSKDKVFDAVDGANMKGIQATGPIAMNFANNESDYSLTDFSMVFMLKFNGIEGTCKIVELLCNTSISESTYEAKAVSISFSRTKSRDIDVGITFGNELYIVRDIDSKVFVNHSILMVSLTFDSKHVNLYINNTLYRFNHNSGNSITLGTRPFVINKRGRLDITMYAFAYYKSCLTFEELSAFKKFMYNHLSGIDKVIEGSQLTESRLLAEKEEALKKSQDCKVVYEKCPVEPVRPVVVEKTLVSSIPKLRTPYPSLMQEDI